jgi:hypothetical protein
MFCVAKWKLESSSTAYKDSGIFIIVSRGARYLMGEHLKVVLAAFLTLKLGRIAILHNKCMAWHAATSRVENSAQGLSHALACTRE